MSLVPDKLRQAHEDMPIEHLSKLDLQAARWLEQDRKALGKIQRRQLWENIWKASLVADWEGELDYDMTLNHAGGILGSVLMDELVEYHPIATAGDNPGIYNPLLPYFELIGDGDSPSAKLARIRLSSNLLYIFRIDREWTEHALLRRMDVRIHDSFEVGLWEGYLWSPRMQEDLLTVLKSHFFHILEKLNLISERVREHAIHLFIVIAVPPNRGVTTREAQEVLQDMHPEHLAAAAWMLKDILSGAGDKAPVLWRETIGPWFAKTWPRHEEAKTDHVSGNLALMAIESDDAFPEVITVVENWLQPGKWGDPLHDLKESNLHKRFPEAAWTLIRHVIGEETVTAGIGLSGVLEELVQEYPEVGNDPYFQRLQARNQ